MLSKSPGIVDLCIFGEPDNFVELHFVLMLPGFAGKDHKLQDYSEGFGFRLSYPPKPL
jgi:hypothetical protein